jgi:hypothetical protein
MNHMRDDTDKIDYLIDRLHKYAELNPTLLQEQCNDESIEFVRDLVIACWQKSVPPERLTPQEFADLIYKLREEEKEWSKKLGIMLLASEDSIHEGNKEVALEYFEYFFEHCPCTSLSNIAKIHKENLGL